MDRELLFSQTVCRLVLDPDLTHRIEYLGDDLAVLQKPTRAERTVVVGHPGIGADEVVLQAHQERMVRLLKALEHESDVILVGGSVTARKGLKKARPNYTPKALHLHHLQPDGTLWSERKRRKVTAVLQRTGAIPEDDWARFGDRRQSDTAEIEEEVAELKGFAAQMQTGSARVTVGFLAVATVMYAVEWILGGTELPPALMRLGALSAPRVLMGEVYRLLSVAFLHGGLMHFAFNMMVLYSLGGFLERIIGSTRFTVMFVLSVLGGSLASVFVNGTPLGVGASGGLWGVLAAQAILAWSKNGILPDSMIPGARKAALTNLGLNAFVSLLPNVDWAAHLGGGLVGGAVMFVLMRLHAGRDAEEGSFLGPAGMGARLGAAGLGGLMVASLGAALAIGQPWALPGAPTYRAVALTQIPGTVELPDLMAPNPLSMLDEQVVGDIGTDPVQCSILVFPYEEGGPDGASFAEMQSEEVTAQMLEDMKTPPAMMTLQGSPKRVTHGDTLCVSARYRFDNGLMVDSIVAILDGALVRLDCVMWPDVEEYAGVPAHAAGSITLGE